MNGLVETKTLEKGVGKETCLVQPSSAKRSETRRMMMKVLDGFSSLLSVRIFLGGQVSIEGSNMSLSSTFWDFVQQIE